MDVRWSKLLVGGVLAASVGCAGLPKQPMADAVPMTGHTPTAQVPPQIVQAAANAPAPAHAPLAAAPQSTKPHQLKPSTILTMGALKEQAAEDKNKPATETEQFRYQARMDYLKVIQLAPKSPAGYLALARSYTATDEREKALATFRRATTAIPTDAMLWYEQGTALARWKDWPAAIDSFKKAVELNPDSKVYGRTLGLTLARAGRYEEAYHALGQVSGEAEARTYIAKMLKHTQRPNECRQQLELALKANPDYAPARELLAEMPSATKAAAHQEPATAAPATLPATVTVEAKPVKVAPPRMPPVLLNQPVMPAHVDD